MAVQRPSGRFGRGLNLDKPAGHTLVNDFAGARAHEGRYPIPATQVHRAHEGAEIRVAA